MKTLKDAKVGETVTVEAPAGEMRFTIVAVANE